MLSLVLNLLRVCLIMLRMVTMPIKNFLSRAKTNLSSFPWNSACMSLNCLAMLPCRTSLNCHDTSGCMMINCPPLHSAISVNPSCAYGPRDRLTIRTDSTIGLSIQNPCPDLDPSSSMDSLQTHDSLDTPESPHLPSYAESLEEGTTTDVTHVAEVTQEGVTQVRTHDTDTQVRTNDSLAYDSLVTALSRLSLEPDPDPLSDHQ